MQEVKDKVAERGITLSNVVLSLLLAATIAYGNDIVTALDKLTETVHLVVTSTKINGVEITHNTKGVEENKQTIETLKVLLNKHKH